MALISYELRRLISADSASSLSLSFFNLSISALNLATSFYSSFLALSEESLISFSLRSWSR